MALKLRDSANEVVAEVFEDDPTGACTLSSAPEFTRLWDRATVSRFHSARKYLRHPTAGALELDYVKLQSAADGQQVIVFLPADQRSEDGVRRLALGGPRMR